MSWNEIAQTNTSRGKTETPCPVVAQSIASTTRMKPRITITLRPEFIGPEADWIVPRATFRLLIGSGEHLGMLRIEKAAQGRTFAGSGGKKAKRPMIILQGLEWLPEHRNAMTSLDHDSGDGWLEITLPAWGRPTATVVHAVAPIAETQPARLKRGVTFVDQVPDPVAARRRCQAPIAVAGGGKR